MFDYFLVASEGHIVYSVESSSLSCFGLAPWFSKVDLSVNWYSYLILVHYNGATFESAPVQHIEHYAIFLKSERVSVNCTASESAKAPVCHLSLCLSLGVLFKIS